MTKDVSQSGMCVLMPCALLPAAQVWVLLLLPSHQQPEPIEARVLWTRAQEDGRFEVGLTFA
jgi:hypothetical protein